MTLSIAVLSQKGGVGKSTIARLVARTYAAAGWQVKIADFNVKQTTSVDWNHIRLAQKLDPTLAAQAFNDVRTALKQKDYDLLVFDGKPESDAVTLELARAANLIVIPTGATQDDLIPQIRFANELRRKGIAQQSMIMVLNGIVDQGTWSQAARTALEDAGYRVAKAAIPSKAAYQNAQNSGRAISETTFQTLNDRAEALAEEVATKLKQLTGH